MLSIHGVDPGLASCELPPMADHFIAVCAHLALFHFLLSCLHCLVLYSPLLGVLQPLDPGIASVTRVALPLGASHFSHLDMFIHFIVLSGTQHHLL